MHRLFIAVDLPEEARQAVCGLKVEMAGARWVPEEQLHLTLRFIGDADDDLLDRIGQELVKVRSASFDLSLVGTGHFPPRGLPRVLWAGIETSPALSDLQTAVEAACVSAGVVPDERRFSPHLTLARLRDTPPELVRQFEARNAGFRCGPFPITAFHLYESSLTQKGAIHRRLTTLNCLDRSTCL